MLTKTIQRVLYTPIINIKAKRLGKELLPFITPTTKKVIDLGCGDCGITWFIKNNVRGTTKITAVDTLDTSLYDIKPIIYNGKKLPFPDNYFDLGYTSFTLHHCTNQKQVLRELLRVCKKRAIIIEEIYSNELEKYVTFANDFIGNRLESSRIKIPFNFHTDEEWKEIYKASGCEVKFQKRVYQLPLWFHTKGVLYQVSKSS
jgi:ubiquinone/menaquinone biosynthesis C-methylase UbiE